MSTRPLRTGSWVVAAVATLAGAVAWLLPSSGAVEPLAPSLPGAVAAPLPALDTQAAEGIVLANAFAASRMAPASRYTPVEQMTDTAAGTTIPDPSGMAAMPMMPGMGTDTSGGVDTPRLLGTIVSPEGPKALLQLGGAGPSLYGAGDREGGWQVVSIAPRQVVLRGRSRRITLRLDPEEERP